MKSDLPKVLVPVLGRPMVRYVLDALRDAAAHHTSLVIAHRLSTIVDADTILVMDKGRVVESGIHQSLIAAGGAYAKLWAMQQEESRLQQSGTEQVPLI